MRINLKRKIWLTVFSIVLVFTVLLMYLIPSQQEKYIIANHKKEVTNLTATVALGVRIALEHQNFEGIQTAMDFAQSEPRLTFIAMTQIDSVENEKGDIELEESVLSIFPDYTQFDLKIMNYDTMIVSGSNYTSSMMNGRIVAGFSTDDIKANMQRIRTLAISVSIAVLLFGIILGLWLGNTISKPINLVKNAAIHVGEGDLSQRVSRTTNDEIGDLSDAFNKMVVDLSKARIKIDEQTKALVQNNAALESEKEKSDSLLLNILPESTANELKIYGKASPKYYESATVLFTDFKDFTKITGQLSPEKLVQELDFCFKRFDEIITEFGLEKIKTIGDAYMCAGGIPSENKSHPFDATKAALSILEFVNEYNKTKRALNAPQFEIRLGIHTGPIVAGIVGLKKFQYDIWGDTVNIASRMESHGEVGKVNISEATYQLIKNDVNFSFEKREELDVKGKGKMKMWFVELKIQD